VHFKRSASNPIQDDSKWQIPIELSQFFQNGHTEQRRWKKCKVSTMCIACPVLEPATRWCIVVAMAEYPEKWFAANEAIQRPAGSRIARGDAWKNGTKLWDFDSIWSVRNAEPLRRQGSSSMNSKIRSLIHRVPQFSTAANVV